MSDHPLFQTTDLTVKYGAVVANSQVSITVNSGEVVGLIGPNGAGKTSMVDAVTGFAGSTGQVHLDGKRIDGLSVHARRRAGLARTWQAGALFGDLSVSQNLAVSTRRTGWRSVFTDIFAPPKVDRSVGQVLELLNLSDVADARPHELSLGVQKIVGVGRALVGNSRMLLLDEPAAGLDTDESFSFGREVRRIASNGAGILLIDHDMNLVLEICDRLVVLDFGKVIAQGTPDVVRQDPAVITAYLGSEVTS